MSDRKPNPQLERHRIDVQLAELHLNLKRFDFKVLEMEEEKQKIAENKEATLKEIDRLTKLLGGMSNG